MRIEIGQTLQKLFSIEQKGKNVLEEKAEKNIASVKKQDEFEFNISAKELNEFFALAKKADVEREEKVQEVISKIQKGEYQVSAKDIISKVLEEKANGPFNN